MAGLHRAAEQVARAEEELRRTGILGAGEVVPTLLAYHWGHGVHLARGAIAVGWDARGVSVLGRMAAEVRELPDVGEPCVVVAQPLGEDGRKLYAATALYCEDGRLLGRARQTWITPRE